MAAFVLRRIVATVVVMAVAALFVFSLLHLASGDPAAFVAGDLATAAVTARVMPPCPGQGSALGSTACVRTRSSRRASPGPLPVPPFCRSAAGEGDGTNARIPPHISELLHRE
jgi:hypothetical protein